MFFLGIEIRERFFFVLYFNMSNFFLTRSNSVLFLFKVLELMKEVAEDEGDSSDISGYHSDSDSAIMMSGNSPYVSKRARYNFLTRSGKGYGRNSISMEMEFTDTNIIPGFSRSM